MTEYTFTVGAHTAQAHEYTDVLIKEAYERDTTPDERVKKSDKLCESHFEQVGEFPDESVLNRLAWYIVFDQMTDKHPDKVTREEYPILSDEQLITRRTREKSVSSVYTGQDDVTIGRYIDGKGAKHRLYDYMTPAKDNAPVPTEYLALYEAIKKAELTDRQNEILTMLFVDGMTQSSVAKRLGISQASVSMSVNAAIDKIRKYLVY